MARVLVVDDDPVIRELVVVNLRVEGHEVLAVADGAEALEVAAAEALDLVLLDVMMPRTDGLEVTRTLRADPATAGVPIVLLSARALDREVRDGLDAGADRYVTKPFDPEDLLGLCDELLAGRGAEEER